MVRRVVGAMAHWHLIRRETSEIVNHKYLPSARVCRINEVKPNHKHPPKLHGTVGRVDQTKMSSSSQAGNTTDEHVSLLDSARSTTESSTSTASFSNKERDKYVLEATQSLNHFVVIAAWTAIVAMIFVFVNEFTDNAIPTWSIFAVLFFGHFLLFIVVIRIMRLILRSLLPKNDAEKATQRWHQANEKRIPLIQYTVYNVSWIFGASFLLVIIEILALLYFENIAPVYASLVPIYLFSGAALMNSILCRSTSWAGALSWALIFAQTILYHIKEEEAYNGTSLNWTEVLIPAFVFIISWIGIIIYVWIQYLRSYLHLQQYQMESLSLYFLAGAAAFVSLYGLMSFLNQQEVFGNVSDEKFATGAALVAICAFFIGLSIAVENIIRATIERMGGERPKALIKTSNGGWDMDYDNAFQNYVITGDIESTKFSHLVNSDDKEKSCGCCSSLELVTRRTLFGFSEGRGDSDEESMPLTRGGSSDRDHRI